MQNRAPPSGSAHPVITLVAWVLYVATAHGAECPFDTRTQPVGESQAEYRVAGRGPDVVLLHGLFA